MYKLLTINVLIVLLVGMASLSGSYASRILSEPPLPKEFHDDDEFYKSIKHLSPEERSEAINKHFEDQTKQFEESGGGVQLVRSFVQRKLLVLSTLVFLFVVLGYNITLKRRPTVVFAFLTIVIVPYLAWQSVEAIIYGMGFLIGTALSLRKSNATKLS